MPKSPGQLWAWIQTACKHAVARVVAHDPEEPRAGKQTAAMLGQSAPGSLIRVCAFKHEQKINLARQRQPVEERACESEEP